MANKNMGRVGNLEREMEAVKIQLERLTEVERKMECLTDGLSKVLAALEETTRSVHSIRKSKSSNNISGKDNTNGMPQEKTLVEDHRAQGQLKTRAPDGLVMGEEQMERTEPEEKFIPLPPYSDYGVKGQLMKVKGRIRNKEVVVLIKTGTTHNFISSNLVKELHLPSVVTGNYRVETVRGNRICKGVTLEMPGLTIVEEFLPFQLLDNVDIILGTKWVRSMELVSFYSEGGWFTMKIKKGKREIVWRADPEL